MHLYLNYSFFVFVLSNAHTVFDKIGFVLNFFSFKKQFYHRNKSCPRGIDFKKKEFHS